MPKIDPILKLESLIEDARKLHAESRDAPEFKKWYRSTKLAIENIFGHESKHTSEFGSIRFTLHVFGFNTSDQDFHDAFLRGIKNSITLLQSFIEEINEYGLPAENQTKTYDSSNEKIVNLINRFHKIARQLQSRHANRPTITVTDEYDVQDLFHALLKIYFDDIRAEDYTPTYAGAASRVDFILKDEKIVIELKKTRPSLRAKELGEQLIVDSLRYQSHPDCEQIICFVYDPDGFIGNPVGIENDLSKDVNGVPVTVIITPK